jgi:predicted 2-oxoglutarate/Fe(II)-dependent dioxygenase YbiX
MSVFEFVPGDRLPNLLIRAHDGTRSVLHAWHRGAPAVLLVARSAAPETVRQALAGFDAQGRVLPLVLGAPAGVEHAPEALRYEIAEDALAALLGGRGDWALWSVGPDLRLRARADSVEAALELLDEASAETQPETIPALHAAAPVLVVPQVLEPELCQAAMRYLFEARGGGDASGVLQYEDGKPVFRLDPSIKMRRETIIEDAALEARLHERIARRVIPEIARAFQFQVQRREHFKLIAYSAGAGYFRAHRDNESPDVAHRRFAMTLNLNTGEYKGGLLRFPEFGPQGYQATAGSALLFSCSVLHEATDITEGQRVAMTTFFS